MAASAPLASSSGAVRAAEFHRLSPMRKGRCAPPAVSASPSSYGEVTRTAPRSCRSR
jgi:hypothetical protein